ncbi:MAG: hypothetical protein C4323_24495 [Mastigocladus sp. ERB_26_2]
MVSGNSSTPSTPHTPRQSLFVGNQQDRARAGSPTPHTPHLPLSHSPTLPTYLQKRDSIIIFLINASGEVDVKILAKL